MQKSSQAIIFYLYISLSDQRIIKFSQVGLERDRERERERGEMKRKKA